MNKAKAHSILLGICAGAALFLSSCAQMGGGSATKRGEVEHVVLVWLKKHGDAADRDDVIAVSKSFQGKIPGILAVSAGHSITSKRPVVDSSFDVGIVIRFKSQAALDAYEASAVHQQAVRDVLKPVAQKLVVYDIDVR